MDPEAIVNRTEAAYQSQDVDQVMELFDPEIVFYWNGWKKADGLEGIRKAHEDVFDDSVEFQIEKTLRAASSETIAVEWETTWSIPGGPRLNGHGGEFWTIRDDRLREWHAYHMQHDQEGEPVPHTWDGPHEY